MVKYLNISIYSGAKKFSLQRVYVSYLRKIRVNSAELRCRQSSGARNVMGVSTGKVVTPARSASTAGTKRKIVSAFLSISFFPQEEAGLRVQAMCGQFKLCEEARC